MTDSYDNPSTRPPGTVPTTGDLDDTMPPSYPAGSGTYETGTLGTTTYQGQHVADDSGSDSAAKEKVGQAKEKAGQVKDQVQGEAQGVKQTAAEAGGRVAGTAKQEAAHVADEARKQAKDVLQQARSQLTSQAGSQKSNVANAIRSVSSELSAMAESSENKGVAANVANQAAGAVDSVASWFEDKEPAELLSEVTDFARRKPGLFLAIAAGTGLVVGRLARSLRDDASDDAGTADQGSGGYAGAGTAGYTTGTYATATTDTYSAPTTDAYSAPTTDTYTAPATSAYGTGTSDVGTPDAPRTTGGFGGTA
ncbi:hypothetical protein [uncultured Cellulomonas sp.]|uniref:hypothetical protein n=1 Tax=uncultured Cellulomonas sp. TaxID=189682 RepID=UPI002621D56F|nr:hypothetical protein [uncultured Cellulomonas sp.]